MKITTKYNYFDTDAEYDVDYVRECFDEGEAPEPGTNAWSERVAELRDMELEDFLDNMAYSKYGPAVCQVCYTSHYQDFQPNYTAYCGADLKDIRVLLRRMNADGARLNGTKEGLVLHAYHHDGSYRVVIRKLTAHGTRYADRHGGVCNLSRDEARKAYESSDLSGKILDYLY